MLTSLEAHSNNFFINVSQMTQGQWLRALVHLCVREARVFSNEAFSILEENKFYKMLFA